MTQSKFAEGLGDDEIQKACSLAMAAHSKCNYHLEKSKSHAFFAFPGSWLVKHWFAQKSSGDAEIDLRKVFPSLRSIGNDETALVYEPFIRQFQAVLDSPRFIEEVTKAVTKKKKIVFTGHSLGGALAVLATIWFLEKYLKLGTDHSKTPLCVTFGSPLIGDRVFGHAIRRENWSDYFVHFVMRYDIVPRILLAPLPSIEQGLQEILGLFNPKSKQIKSESTGKSQEISSFFRNIMTNASSVASRTACSFMGCTNMLLETITSFIELSPYRPFGTYVFCTDNGKMVILKNSDAILQILFYCLQLRPGEELQQVAYKSLNDHKIYVTELQKSLAMQDVVHLDLENPEELPLSSEDDISDGMKSIGKAMNDLELSTKARLCLRAAGEYEKQKQRNKDRIQANRNKIDELLASLQTYRDCKVADGYYAAFKLQRHEDDFLANVKRLELAGMWDEIIEMLKRYELPDDFEGSEEWINLGTKFRRLVEPLDIANYYRHSKDNDTKGYMGDKGRPKRYRYTQRWLEHKDQKEAGFYSESCFWAELEALGITRNRIASEKVEEKVLQLKKEVEEKVLQLEKEVKDKGELLGREVLLAESPYVKCLRELGRMIPPVN